MKRSASTSSCIARFIAAFLLTLTAVHEHALASSGPAHASGTRIIEYYGDSTVWGYRSGTGGQVDKPAPAAFAEALPKGMKFEVRNEGVNGATACELLNGTDGKHAPWPVQMAASKATYVFISFAINDQWKHDIDTYQSCLRSLARIAKRHGKQVILETPNPTRDSGATGLDVYVDAMREVAAQEKLPVIDQYKYLSDMLNGRNPDTICPDGLHPADHVYVLKGRFAAKMFSNLFLAK